MMPDLPLPLPLGVIKALLVIVFLSHIVFVNMMVGGTFLSLIAHRRGLQDPDFLTFARSLLKTVSVHKSIAVVLGVGPLLLISLAYTVPFYTSGILIAPAWLSVLLLVTIAFLSLYTYTYTWESWRLRHPRWHAMTGLLAMLCLLCIPLIFLTNTNLMLEPHRWHERPSFFTALFTVGNVFPRYFHFLLASVALTGVFIALWWGRQTNLDEAYRQKVVRFGTLWALIPTSLQFLAGPTVLFTLPKGGISALLIIVLAPGILCALVAIFLMIDSLKGRDRMKWAALLLVVTILAMGTGRHIIRENLLSKADASSENHSLRYDVKQVGKFSQEK